MFDESLKAIIGDRELSDDMLECVKNIRDAYNEQKNLAESWKAKHDELHEKYIERFFSVTNQNDEAGTHDTGEDSEPKRFDDLFSDQEE